MGRSYFALAALAIAAVLPIYAAIPEPVRIETGQITGSVTSSPEIRAFEGIPYAAPPVGDLRWRSPRPPAPWQGVRKADKFADACMQPIRPSDPLMRPDDGPASEDCLYLNVWTGAKSANEKRPVMVWIHGGGFRSGAASMPHYNGEYLAKKGVVVVSISYRLGLFGFFAHPELSKESDRNASGNYAIQDMMASLEWVKKNIAAFGGDPGKVTIWGQSAGASGVNALIASPLAKGLFQQAIAQSGGVGGNNGRGLAATEKAGVEFATAQGAGSLAELRARPGESLRNANWQGSIIADGWVLPEDVQSIFAKGTQNPVTILVGSNGDEGQNTPKSAEEFVQQTRNRLGDRADAFLKIYPAGTLNEATVSQRTSAAMQTFFGMWNEARLQTTNTRSKAYLYMFTHAPPLPKGAKLPTGTSEAFGLGAYHGSELVYQFMTLKTRDWPWSDLDFKIADTLSSYWTNFAKTGDPNGRGLANWPAYDEKTDRMMDIGDTIAARPVPHKDGLKFLEANVVSRR